MSSSLSPLACSLILALTLLAFLAISICSILKEKRKGRSAIEEYDDFFSARNSQPWWSIGLSCYSAGMGSWLLFAPPETGILAGWLGSIAYGISNASPFWIMIWLGPRVKTALGGHRGFTVIDFVRERYGRKVQTLVSALSLFFMFIFLCAELTSIGGVLSSVSPSFPPIAAIVPVSLVTLTYIILGGAPASISTDRIQGIVLLSLGVIAVVLVSTSIVPELDNGTFSEASNLTIVGFNAAIVLWISTTLNQFLDQGMWQLVFASQSKKDAQLGLFFGGLLTIPTVVLFACTGIFASAANMTGIISIEPGAEPTALFVLLRRLSPFWLGLVALLGVGLVCSTVDSLQSGLMGLVAGELIVNPSGLMYARICCVAINVFATIVAAAQFSVLSLFLVSNIISCSIVPMLGLAFCDCISPLAAFVGFLFGIITIMLCGWGFTRTFVGGFEWFVLPFGPYTHETAITFVLTPTITIIATIATGHIHCWKIAGTHEAQQQCLARMRNATPTEGKIAGATSDHSTVCVPENPVHL